MNNSYLRHLIRSGIKAVSAGAALAAAALILNSDSKSDNKPEQPKPGQPTAPADAKAPAPETSKAPEATVPEKPEHPSCAFPDSLYLTINDIYVPDTREAEKADVPYLELTEKQAVEQGYSFRKKSKSVRITNYHGKKRDIIIPSKIGGKPVNELSARAFKMKRLDSVEIPDSVKKAGDELFYGSTVREVIFGSGIRVIPKKAFDDCAKLSRVVLPDTVFEIRESAFSYCCSLEYIRLPDSLFKVGKYAFWDSGLRGFSTKFPIRLNDGSAFAFTPLHKMYKLIAARNTDNELQVLLTSNNAKIKFPQKRVVLKKSSFQGDCELDFSECTKLDIEDAFREYSNASCSRKIVVRHGQDGYYFGKKAKVTYTDGSPYPALLQPIAKLPDALAVRFTGRCSAYRFLPSGYVNFGIKHLRIFSDTFMTIREHAFSDQKLERLDLGHNFTTEGEIFSAQCTALREVCWKDKYNPKRYIQYIPPAEVITDRLHSELLKAFRPSNNGFFDSSVIDKLFSDRELKYMCCGKTTKLGITNRQLIPIAIAVLRSTPELFTNGTKAYSDYLRRHLRYAKTVCEKLQTSYPEYAEFLAAFK